MRPRWASGHYTIKNPEKYLKLKVDAQVMMIKNDPERRWVNGTIGFIHKLQKDKIFVKMQLDRPLLKNTELSVLRQYKYQDSESIQNRIYHIKEFMECCNNNPEDKDCFHFQRRDMWNQREYDELVNNKYRPSRHVKRLNKIILINDYG